MRGFCLLAGGLSSETQHPCGGADLLRQLSNLGYLESGAFRIRDPLNNELRVLSLRLDDTPSKVFTSRTQNE